MQYLSDKALGQVPADVARPLYDRSALQAGIVHLGVGAFHRAHQAVLTEDCLNAGETGWGITAASLRSAATRDALAPQDQLYTLALRSSEAEDLRVVGAIRSTLVAPENPAALLAALASAGTRIVSLTITEKGYSIDGASGVLRLDDPDIRHDLTNPGLPRTALGFLAEALRQRRAAGIAPFALLSCDNLAQNGRKLHQALSDFGRAQDPGLGDFIAAEVACPSCMVDRIVPATTDADRAAISARLGVTDAWPVVAEPFFQWVIEDRFPLGRPGWERSGVEFARDVVPFEVMKLRLLNGAHSTLAAIGRLGGVATVAEAMAHPVIRAFIAAYWAEVSPSVPAHIDAAAYARRLSVRFDNRSLQHKLAQIAADGSQKVPPRMLAPLRDLRAARAPIRMLRFAIAAWLRSCDGVDDGGQPLPIADPVLAGWTGRPGPGTPPAQAVQRWLAHAPVFGTDLARDADFATALTADLTRIRSAGVIAAASERLENPDAR